MFVILRFQYIFEGEGEVAGLSVKRWDHRSMEDITEAVTICGDTPEVTFHFHFHFKLSMQGEKNPANKEKTALQCAL